MARAAAPTVTHALSELGLLTISTTPRRLTLKNCAMSFEEEARRVSKGEANFKYRGGSRKTMGRKIPNRKARREVPRPEWPYPFRELMSLLCAPERWARARKIVWSEDLERLRKDLLYWVWHLAGAPRVGPDGFADVLPVGSVIRPTARNVLIAANKEHREEARPASALVGDPNALSFRPVICEIAYKLAGRARGRARAKLAQPGTQWIMQAMVQRV